MDGETFGERYGPDLREVQRIASAVLAPSPGGTASVDDVVARTAIDFSTVRAVLESDGWGPETARLLVEDVPDYVDLTANRWSPPAKHDPARQALTKQLRALVGRVPAPKIELDHVQATAETVADRALLLGRSIDLVRSSVLLLGDHDLTALAIALLEPRCSITVVDVDEDLLEYVAAVAPAPLRTLYADLRLGLPPGLSGQMDVVLTDPPYSVPGMNLFIRRARAALRPEASSRLLLAYGYSTRALRPALSIQRGLIEEDLLIEAVLPQFNRYDGAPAIGMQADMTVARVVPSRRRWEPVSDVVEIAVYSRGPNAVNVDQEPAQTEETATTGPDLRPGCIRLKPVRERPSPSRIDHFLYGKRPPKLVSAGQNCLEAELDAGLSGLAHRLALAAPAVDVVEIRCDGMIPPPGPGLRKLLESRWSWTPTSVAGRRLRFEARPGPTDGVAFLASRAMSKLGKTAIESRIRDASTAGRVVTKREAKEALARFSRLTPLLDDTIVDLPDWAMAEVVQYIEQSG